jgi:hypothetical protein
MADLRCDASGLCSGAGSAARHHLGRWRDARASYQRLPRTAAGGSSHTGLDMSGGKRATPAMSRTHMECAGARTPDNPDPTFHFISDAFTQFEPGGPATRPQSG